MLLSACVGFASYCPVIAANQQSGAVVSKSIAKPLRAAVDAIDQKQYDVALARVMDAQSVPAKKSAYDSYVMDSLLFEIYAGKGDTEKAIAMLDLVARSQYATNESLRTAYLAVAQYEFKQGIYDKALALVHIAKQHGATEVETADLIASAERSRASELRWSKAKHIDFLRPRRRDTPLRYLNISDNEVREIQSAVATHASYEFVSIAGVVTGCPAEEGSACTDQVWVELRRHGKGGGLLLSKVNNQWIIGVVQQWYLCDEALDARRDGFSTYFDYMAAKQALVESFPSCVDQQAVPPHP